MESFEFPAHILDRARNITLADLMDSPVTQCWAVSMACNAFQTASLRTDQKDWSEDDELFEFKLKKLMEMIPHSERADLFRQCANLIGIRKEAARAHQAAGAGE